jgi:hypothetical protein
MCEQTTLTLNPRSLSKDGVFAVPIFSFKFYVIGDRNFIPSVQRNAKAISFAPFRRQGTKLFGGCGELACKLRDPDEGGSVAASYDRIVKLGLSAGADLDPINMMTAKENFRLVDELATKSSAGPVNLDLYSGLRHVASLGSTAGIYGPQNPYRDLEHEADYW